MRRSWTYARAARYATTQTAIVCIVHASQLVRRRFTRSAYGWGSSIALALSMSLLAAAIAFGPWIRH